MHKMSAKQILITLFAIRRIRTTPLNAQSSRCQNRMQPCLCNIARHKQVIVAEIFSTPYWQWENCYYRTPNNGLRCYRTPNIDFAKTAFETWALCFTWHLGIFSLFSSKYMYLRPKKTFLPFFCFEGRLCSLAAVRCCLATWASRQAWLAAAWPPGQAAPGLLATAWRQPADCSLPGWQAGRRHCLNIQIM